QFSLFGRAGVFFWDAEIIVDGFSIDVPEDDNPYYGAGARVDISPNFTLVGDWSRYELDDVDTDVISIGFQYYFGN
ncbi:MAG: porin family protein, partial [Gammaproteobacteria bacterium]|nr:porin family protein [Gammaproteobacteria bacterium]